MWSQFRSEGSDAWRCKKAKPAAPAIARPIKRAATTPFPSPSEGGFSPLRPGFLRFFFAALNAMSGGTPGGKSPPGSLKLGAMVGGQLMPRMAAVQTLGQMWVTRSALTQLMTPVSTSATWNNVGTFGFLAPPSTQITSAIRQAPSESVMTTASPGLTCKKIGSDLGAATALAWSIDILLY